METARAGWLCLLHEGEVGVLASSLDTFELPCDLRGEVKATVPSGFTSLAFPHGGRKMGYRSASASWF
jgi:hypothetical protein